MLQRRGTRSRGLTLIEIIVVIAIISLLMGAVGIYALGHLVNSRIKVARLDVKTAVQALDTYRAMNGRYPAPADGFAALQKAMVLREVPKDPWGNALTFTLVEGEPVVLSYGADGKPGGEGEAADISSASTD